MDIIHIVAILGACVVAAIIIFYLLQQVNLPDPIRRMITIAAVVIIGIILIIFILRMGGVSTRIGSLALPVLGLA